MPLYYIQARDDENNSFDLFVREDDPDRALLLLAEHYEIKDYLDDPLITSEQVRTIFDGIQMFVVPENTCNGVIPWDDDQGVKCIFCMNMGACSRD